MVNKQERKRITAVEWLIQQMFLTYNATNQKKISSENIIQHANKMFEEQMLEFWQEGINSTEEGGKCFDQYFNENYKK
jgi:hypothetical protein